MSGRVEQEHGDESSSDEDEGVPVPTHLRGQKKPPEAQRAAAADSTGPAPAPQPSTQQEKASPPGVWAALAGTEDDPDAAWDILRQTQIVRKIPQPATTPPPKAGHTRFVCFSDTHTRHEGVVIPPGDVLIHAGDFTNTGLPTEVQAFNEFLARQPHAHKIVIAGNHDLTMDQDSYPRLWKKFKHPQQFEATQRLLSSATYLLDQEVTVRGFRIYGSPWQPEFCHWAFNLPRGKALKDKWDRIPQGLDVLVTHGPPVGHGDECRGGQRAGCVDLLQAVQRVRPAYHVFGHVHEGYGVTEDGMGIKYINASTCTVKYKPDNPCVVFDLPDKSG